MQSQQEMFKQMMDFQKTVFENSFGAMTKFQDQAETMMDSIIQQATWMPDEGKDLISDWTNSYKSGRDELKKMMDDNYKKVEKFWNGLDK